MLEFPDFYAKKVVLVFPKDGDKISFKNDNFIVTDFDNKIKVQVSCYKLFAIYIVGGFSVTTGLIEKSKKFGFSIIFFTFSFKVYATINFQMEGNTLLRKKQYLSENSNQIAKMIVINKIENQRDTLKKMRNTNVLDGVMLLDKNIANLIKDDLNTYEIMGIEGSAAKVYFNRIFYGLDWNGRKPRVKPDKINVLLDIGYTVLFNYIEGILNLYGFDIYKGNLHKEFYKRKSLVCDIIETFRPIVDYRIRKAFNLKQLGYNFSIENNQYILDWKDSNRFVQLILEEILQYREAIFKYVQSYYRWIMKEKEISEFPKVRLEKNDFN